jgi:hypothetical protein
MYYTLEVSNRNKVVKIIAAFAAIEDAVAFGENANVPDYRVLSSEALAKLSMPDLVTLHNAHVSKKEAVEKFVDKDSAVSRLIAAFHEDTAGEVFSIPFKPTAITEEVKTMATKSKKTKAPKAKKATVDQVIEMTEAAFKRSDPESKDKKIWQAKSARKAAFDYLIKCPNGKVKLSTALASLSESLKLKESQVRSLIQKMKESKLLTLTEIE